MRTTAILNQKGGVGKTVTVVNMAAILAHDCGKRVLVVDADSQANTTEFLGGGDFLDGKLSDLLRRKQPETVIYESSVPGVDLIAADDSLMDLDLSSVKSKEADVAALGWMLEECKGGYDFCLIDCPPAFNAACAAALIAADDVIIPIKLDAFSLRGMANLTRQIRNMTAINPRLEIAGVLPTMAYPSKTGEKSLDILIYSDYYVFPKIRRTGKVDDMTFAQRPLIQSSPRSAACVDYRRFVREYVRGGGEHGGV